MYIPEALVDETKKLLHLPVDEKNQQRIKTIGREPRFTEKKVRTTLDDISEEKKAKIRKTLKEKAAILKEEYRYIDD